MHGVGKKAAGPSANPIATPYKVWSHYVQRVGSPIHTSTPLFIFLRGIITTKASNFERETVASNIERDTLDSWTLTINW